MQKAGESSAGFHGRRIYRFFKVLFSNRMSAIGMLILIASGFMVLASYVFYPQSPDPQHVIAGASNVPPEWMSYFPDGYTMSKNMVVGTDPGFASPSSIQQWRYVYDPSLKGQVSFSWIPGNLLVSSSSGQSTNVSIVQSFFYPYHGPPGKFVAQTLQVSGTGVNATRPTTIGIFIERGPQETVGQHTYVLWNTSLTQDHVSTGPTYLLDSTTTPLRTTTASKPELAQLTLAQDIFSQRTNYAFGVTINFPGSRCSAASPCTVTLTQLGLTLSGTSYGLLGTDVAGTDLFAQLLWGARVSLLVGLLAALIGIVLGLIVGLIAGYKTGIVDELLMRFTDMILVLPALPLLLVLLSVIGHNLQTIILVIGFLGWMGFARVIRSQVLTLKERPFIEASKAAGAGTGKILTTHIFPNVVSLTYVNLALSVPGAILTEAALSFLGLGDPTVISWGEILQRVQENGGSTIWWWILPPGIAIAIVSLSFVLIGYALDEIFNPKLRKRR